MSVTIQQRWNRYVGAINYCFRFGYLTNMEDSIDASGNWNGNVRKIVVSSFDFPDKVVSIPLKPKKYTGMELLRIIVENYGILPSLKKGEKLRKNDRCLT